MILDRLLDFDGYQPSFEVQFVFETSHAMQAALLAAGLLGSASASAGIIVQDASFETPDLGDGSSAYNPTGAAWTFTGYAGISHQNSPFFKGLAPDGSQSAFLQTVASGQGYYKSGFNGTMSQIIYGLVAGVTYQVGFYLASRGSGYDPSPLNITFGGSDLGTFSNPTTDFVRENGASYAATRTTALLVFSSNPFRDAKEQDVAIDDVTVTEIQEPASIILLSSCMLYIKRRKYPVRPGSFVDQERLARIRIRNERLSWITCCAIDGGRPAGRRITC